MPDHDYSKVIAIDGPVASGKSSVAQRVAEVLGAEFFDTGLLYRALALAALRNGLDQDDTEGLAKLAANLDFEVGEDGSVLLAGQDVTDQIRSREVEQVVSQIAGHGPVRAELAPIQRRIAGSGKPLVMVGRDIATVIVPEAGLKIFLDASLQERARRRYQQRLEVDEPADYQQILQEVEARDFSDRTRIVAPLTVAADAWIIDTDPLTFDQVVAEITERAVEQWSPQKLSAI